MADESPSPQMYRLAVEYLAERDGVPMARIYQDALDALIASRGLTTDELRAFERRRTAKAGA